MNFVELKAEYYLFKKADFRKLWNKKTLRLRGGVNTILVSFRGR